MVSSHLQYLPLPWPVYVFLFFAVGVLIILVQVGLLRYVYSRLGISPGFIPPVVACAVSCLVAWSQAPAVAYVSGSLGTLIGADLMNLGNIRGVGTPIASIGGAGTFDGIFVTGIFAVVLASLVGGLSARRTAHGH
jgi:uncharacterized membrane protein